MKIEKIETWSEVEKIVSDKKFGMYKIPDELYFRMSELGVVNNSQLKPINKSYRSYCYQQGDPIKSDALEYGKIIDCLVFTPELFDSLYAIGPDVSRATKIWKEFEANSENINKILIKQYELIIYKNQIDSLWQNSTIKQSLTGGDAQVVAFWEADGILKRAKCDYLKGQNIYDLKTTSDTADVAGFTRSIIKYQYHRQEAWYREGFSKFMPVDKFIFVVSEKAPPYLSNIHEIDENFSLIGFLENSIAVKKYKKLLLQPELKNQGYEDELELTTISPPFWIQKNLADEVVNLEIEAEPTDETHEDFLK